jgi:cyanophycinase
MGPGLGFLPGALVDQHFSQRARLGRLARALFELPPHRRIGFGVDEDTALEVDLARGEAWVAGSGHVTLLDARTAVRDPGRRFGARGLRLSMLSQGDSVDLATLAVRTSAGKLRQGGLAGTDPLPPDSGGMAADLPPVAELLEDALLAAGGAPQIVRRSFEADGAVAFIFRRLPDSAVLVGQDAGGRRSSLLAIGFDILPQDIEFRDAGQRGR